MSEERRQHIEFVQNNIIRMNQLSFQIKGMAVTILTALLGAYAAIPKEDGNRNNMFMHIADISLFIFWCLDSYYLQQERKFRGLYDSIINGKKSGIKKYDMQLGMYQNKEYSFFRCIFSKTEIPYLIVIVLLYIWGKLYK